MSRAVFYHQRLPCVALFLAAAAGAILGRWVVAPGWFYAALGAVALLAALSRVGRLALLPGVALVFAAAQTWQYRESPATILAARLDLTPRVCQAEITVLDAPHVFASPTTRRCSFPARLDEVTTTDGTFTPGCRVLVTWSGEPPVYGGRYAVAASIMNCPPPRNPGTFDYAAWLANGGIRSQLAVLRARDTQLLAIGGNPIKRFALASRDWVARVIALGIEGTPEAALILGMTLGETTDTPDALKDAFRETGTFHLFSVSGLHVGIVAVLLWTALGLLGVGQRRSVFLIIPALFFYALVTGLSAASVRAAIMLSFIAAGLLVDRPAVALNSIGAAGLLILGADSSQLFNSGFQLSFGAVTAIILLARPLGRRIDARFDPDPFLPPSLLPRWQRLRLALIRAGVALTAVSFAAWLISLPLIVYYFHLISFSSIPANLLAVPLSSVVLALAAIALVAGAVSPWLAEVFNQTNFLLTKGLIAIVQFFAALPGSSVYVDLPGPPDTVATLTILDAESGAAAVLQTAGRTWAIDTGPDYFADSVTLPFLRWRGVNQLDALVLTHGDTRHIGGAPRLLETLHPRMILDSLLPDRSPTHRGLLKALRASSADLVPALAGRTFPLGPDARATVLYPPADLSAGLADDKAIVLRVEIGPFAALLVSDAGIATEQWLLAHATAQLPCDLVVMGRHNSGFSGDPDFLHVARPRAIIATAAPFPRAEQIRPAWAEAVRALGVSLYRQDETGAVTVTIRRDAFTVSPFLPGGPPLQIFSHADASDPVR